ncbi:MAG: hypothetical protein DRN04_09655 [Thermoprotei archaeon]|nr:MAG: hypothetical protein DRN04_09655 [Thermoprotei archaeon]
MGFMGMGLIIPRSEAKKLEGRGWVLLYGRRKTGKTFLVRSMIHYDYYFFVTRGREIFCESAGNIEILTYSVFLERLKNLLRDNIVLVIDEFQRLPENFLDFLHYAKSWSKAKVILVGSSMLVSRKIMHSRSPLLGIVKPVKLGLAKPLDVLRALLKLKRPEEALMLAPLVSDPWILEFIDLDKPYGEIIDQIVEALRLSARGLVGEVFLEEERELTERYEAVLRAIACGCKTPGEVASYLSGILSEHLKSQDVKKYISNLVEMGLVRKIKVFNKKRYLYTIDSPLLDLFFYLDAKLGFYELRSPLSLTRKKAVEKIPFYYERFVVDLFAQILDAEVQKRFQPEIDGVLVRGRKPIAAIEVKMGKVSLSEVYDFKSKVSNLVRRLIVVAKSVPENISKTGVEIYTPEKIAEIVKDFS